MDREFEIAIVGGGVVGAAIGYGLAKLGRRVIVIDGADDALRASRTNFGLIWVQGKGDECPEYHRITRQSADLWPAFAMELKILTGIDVEHRRNGGLLFCVSESQAEEERIIGEKMAGIHPDYHFEMLDRSRLENMLPDIRLGPQVCAASFSHMDGDVNPLLVLRALLDGFVRLGGTLATGENIYSITPILGGFRLATNALTVEAERVIVAAGNDSTDFAKSLDLPIRLVPERGQLLITERVAPVFSYAASGIRQTVTGTFQLGTTNERVGRSVDVTSGGARHIANRALNVMPDLGALRVIRQWGGLRVLTPDGVPVYDRSRRYPGVHVVACHSGVTLAALHSGPFAEWLAAGGRDPSYAAFCGSRFTMGVAA
ncbi:D-nopaline dehydrogenase [Mesorhizobium loti]|uniref:NAD(P)/FAD-dependent oxidoreductase n=1 Tax=Mesorhizobium TaxID=68287 RepID=UPI000BAE758F|nr:MULTISPECIES: FAD-dependent oxidoreductase [Mesorhizobium]PBB11759.1 D-nopaline dehydrogenase [Mesorhizobium loti]PBC07522.1 D-nopaline dehydrogenase [Mesorhizobium sp. WSM3859]